MYQLYSRRFVIWYCSSYFVFENRNCNTLKPTSRKTMLIKRKTNVGILMLIQLVVYIFINNFIKNCCSSSYLKFLIANWISSSVIGQFKIFSILSGKLLRSNSLMSYSENILHIVSCFCCDCLREYVGSPPVCLGIFLLIFLVFCVLVVFVMCLVCPILPVSLDSSCLIAPSVFSDVYSFYHVGDSFSSIIRRHLQTQ